MQGSGYSRKRLIANGLVSTGSVYCCGSSTAERRIVDPEDVGSIPIRGAIFDDSVGEWLSHEAFNLVIAGSNPAFQTMLGLA